MAKSKRIKIVEVGPRDGLQNEKTFISTDNKVHLIDLLSETGLQSIEITSFVSPKWVPQLADAPYVVESIKRHPAVSYSVLVPNLKGLDAALEAGIKEIAVFTAASETFNHKNTNCSMTESLERLQPVIGAAIKNHMTVRGYISCAATCPYEGPIKPSQVARVAQWLATQGCAEISLGDTTGDGTPEMIGSMLEEVIKVVPVEQLAGHYHDTRGRALKNIIASLELGIRTFDSSIAGLGGCPYAPGAKGNIATEKLVCYLHSKGYDTGVDFLKLIAAKTYVTGFIQL